MTSSYYLKTRTSAEYLLERRNPQDGGWGLNIERGHQASSIVNTAEALFVIRSANLNIGSPDLSVQFLRMAIEDHPNTRGDNLRFLTFGIFGLLEAGVVAQDAQIQDKTRAIEARVIQDSGWAERHDDKVARLWQTFQALWLLSLVCGAEAVSMRYRIILGRILEHGRSNNYRWGFAEGESPSLAATSYALMLLAIFYPNTPDVAGARTSVTQMLRSALHEGRQMEVESIPGTDWHHYSYCWAIRALHHPVHSVDVGTLTVTREALEYINSLYIDGRGYSEPGKGICNVRSTFNNILAIDGISRGFDPMHYDAFYLLAHRLDTAPTPKSVFVSFSYDDRDKQLVDGFQALLQQRGWIVITGEKNPMGSLSKNIIRKIRGAEKFIGVMTKRDRKSNRKFTTSSWLLEEKGAAVALGKPCLLLVEEGIDSKELGGLHGDDQRLHFTRNDFTSAVANALRMLEQDS